MYRWRIYTLRMSRNCTVEWYVWVVAGPAQGPCRFTSNPTQAGGITLPCMSNQQTPPASMRPSMPLAH